MSIERTGGYREVYFVCDTCGEVCETGTDEFMDALREVKDAGWKVEKLGGEWVHTCPDCQAGERAGFPDALDELL